MFDVLPPSIEGDADAFSRRRRNEKKRRARMRTQAANVKSTTTPSLPYASNSRIVEMNWKLPARLRKPIRQQLQKERVERKKREAIIRFQRRPITTHHIEGQKGSRRLFEQNVGAEHHTGDVYTRSRPTMRVALPPYAGSFSQRLLTSSRPSRKRVSVQTPPSASKQVQSRKVVRPKAPPLVSYTQKPPRLPKATVMPVAERDIPFFWEGYAPRESSAELQQSFSQQEVHVPVEEQIIEEPKKAFALPFTLNIWPLSLFSSKKKFQNQNSVAKSRNSDVSFVVRNIAVLVIAFVGCSMFVWNLQSVGRGVSVFSSAKGKAQEAYARIMTAQAAFAETDFKEGEQELSKAQNLFADSRQELREALSAAAYVLKAIDVTNTVDSGDRLLSIGEDLTAAGQHVARGASGFFTVDILPEEDTETATATTTLVDALIYARDEFAQATTYLDSAEENLKEVGSPFLPQDIADQIKKLSLLVPKLNTVLKGFNQQSATLLDLLGEKRQRQYLITFANNDELRPVGGFIGSVGLINVDHGQVENIDVSSVYDPDGQLKEYIAPPDPLLPITNRWYMRDANWFVDYKQSAKKIASFFEKEGGPTVDGVILMTPDVITRLLRVTGPIAMPGYGVTVSADNFSVVTQAQVTYEYDREMNKPKQFLADLTPVLLNRLLSDTSSHAKVLTALADAVQEKDMLLYFKDEDIEKTLEEAGWAGTLPPTASGYLMVNNANIGGHKSDQFIEQEIDYRVSVAKDGKVEATVAIRRTHHGPAEAHTYDYPDGEDPAKKDNIIFQRVLVPKGSHIVEAKGYTPASQVPKVVLSSHDAPLTPDSDVAHWQSSQMRDASGTLVGEESGYTTFSNWIITKPGETTLTLYRYELPTYATIPGFFVDAGKFSMYVGKQAGAKRTTLRASLELPENVRTVRVVPQEGITQDSDHALVYRGALNKDIVIGAAYEKQ